MSAELVKRARALAAGLTAYADAFEIESVSEKPSWTNYDDAPPPDEDFAFLWHEQGRWCVMIYHGINGSTMKPNSNAKYWARLPAEEL